MGHYLADLPPLDDVVDVVALASAMFASLPPCL
jgi:hypothetical protein